MELGHAMKTTKQIADSIGVSKQQVYRYIKKHCINEVLHDALPEALRDTGVKYYDEAVESAIKTHFVANGTASKKGSEAHHEVLHDAGNEALSEAVVSLLREELAIKNKQIETLHEALLNSQRQAEAAQALHAAEKMQLLSDASRENDISVGEVKKSFWDRFMGR